MATSNSLNMDEAGIQTYNTSTGNLTGSATTQYNVLIGDVNNKLTNVAPSATSGVPLISQGSSANPAFGTAVVAGGGTGDTSFTAYAVITGGTTSTGALQNVSGLGTSGQILTSNGAGTLPTWQDNSSGAGLLVASGTLTSAQIKALHGSPIQAIAAPGSGKILIPIAMSANFDYGGTNAFTASASQTINAYWGTNQRVSTSDFMINSFITSTSNILSIPAINPTTLATTSLLDNQAITFYNNVSTEISGNAANNNTITWQIIYYVKSI